MRLFDRKLVELHYNHNDAEDSEASFYATWESNDTQWTEPIRREHYRALQGNVGRYYAAELRDPWELEIEAQARMACEDAIFALIDHRRANPGAGLPPAYHDQLTDLAGVEIAKRLLCRMFGR